MTKDRLSEVAEKEPWTGSRALVPVPIDACPSCGLELDTETVDQRPLPSTWRLRRGEADDDAPLPLWLADASRAVGGQAVTASPAAAFALLQMAAVCWPAGGRRG